MGNQTNQIDTTDVSSENKILETTPVVKKSSKGLIIAIVIIVVLILICLLTVGVLIIKNGQAGISILNNAVSPTVTPSVTLSVTPFQTIESTITVTPTQTVVPTISTFSAYQATVQQNPQIAANFVPFEFPNYVKVGFTKVDDNATQYEDAMYFGKYKGGSVVFAVKNNEMIGCSLIDNTYNVQQISDSSLKISLISDKYLLVKNSDPTKLLNYSVDNGASAKFIYISIFTEDISGNVKFDYINRQAVDFIKSFNLKGYENGYSEVMYNEGAYSIIKQTSCTNCDEVLEVVFIVNWDAQTVKYISEGHNVFDFKIDTKNNTLVYVPQVFDKWEGMGQQYAVYKDLPKTTIALP